MQRQGSKEASKSQMERRKYIRYYASGSLVLDSDGQQYSGVPLNLSLGGILFRADPMTPQGTRGTLRLQVTGFEETILAEVQVIRSYGTAGAAVFTSPSAAVARCVAWLARKEREKEG